MTQLSTQQIAQYAYDAGFRGEALKIAVAVAMAESSGNTQAYNPESAAGTQKGSGSRGLWQIYGQAHPEFNSDAMYDPAANARAAYAVYKAAGEKFTPWSTFNSGNYQAVYRTLSNITAGISAQSKAAAETVGAVASVTAGNTSSLLPPGLLKASDTIGKISDALNNPVKQKIIATDISLIVFGSTFIILGIILFFWAAAKSVGADGAIVKAATGV